jgi:hypothetical protein
MRYSFIFLFIGALAGCAGTPPASDATTTEAATPAARASEIALAIRADPTKADEILAAHQLDRVQFEALLFEVAQDPAAARAYDAALAGP